MSSIVLKSVLVEYISIVIPEKYSEMDLSTNYVANMLVLIIPIAIALFCLYYSGTEKDGKFRNDISLMFIFVSCVIFFYNLKISKWANWTTFTLFYVFVFGINSIYFFNNEKFR